MQREAFITLMRQNKPLIFVSFSTCAFWHFEHNKAVSLLLQYTESEGKHLYRYLPNWMTLTNSLRWISIPAVQGSTGLNCPS